MKEFLSRAGREFVVKNVDEDESAYDELFSRGWRTIPVTIVGSHTIKGFDPTALQAALDETPSL